MDHARRKAAESVRWLILLLIIAGGIHPAMADPPPAWVYDYCSGEKDYHPLTREMIHATPDGWHIDGYHYPVPYGMEQASPDGQTYAAFWADLPGGDQSRLYCFFKPREGF